MAFYTSDENASGKLQTRIDLGVSSLTTLVQNFFIDMLPLFASAIVSLVIMFNAKLADWYGWFDSGADLLLCQSATSKSPARILVGKCVNTVRLKAAWLFLLLTPSQ